MTCARNVLYCITREYILYRISPAFIHGEGLNNDTFIVEMCGSLTETFHVIMKKHIKSFVESMKIIIIL